VNTDFKIAFRTLRKSPSFSFIAIVTLALVIGANATVFSVLEAILLRPLPIDRASQVFFLETAGGGLTQSMPDYRDLKARIAAFSDLAAYRITPMAVQSDAGAERVWGYLATGNYFELLGVRPALGRFFTAQEDGATGASPVAVLSYESWQRRFRGDSAIVGRTVRINNLPYTILGVAPRGFQGTEIFYRPDVWIPMSMQPQIEARNWLDLRNTHNVFVVGRLRDGMTPDVGVADLNGIAKTLAVAYPDSFTGVRFQLVPPGLLGNMGRAPMRAFMLGVMVLAGLVLLAGCANLGSLLSARILDRFRDIAIRLAIGGSRVDVLRYVVAEVALLAVAGGTAGYGLAVALLQLLSRWQLPLALPVQFDVAPDPTVVAFAAVATVSTAAIAALAPARHAWRMDPARLVSASSAPAAFGWRLRDLLLAAQVALCCVVISASVVSIRSLDAALKVPIGFNTAGVTAVGLDLSAAGYTPQDGLIFQQRALDVAYTIPGVTAAAFSSSLPLTVDRSTATVSPSDVDLSAARRIETLVYEVSPRILDVLETRLVAGRTFTVNDGFGSEPVAIVNRAFARQVLLTEDAINMRFRTFAGRTVRVVGLVDDGKYGSLVEAPQPAMFRPVAQSYSSTMVLLVRSSRADASLQRELERIVTGLDPRVPLLSRGSLADAIAVAFLPARAASVALTSFGLLAVLLAVVGVYGLAMYSVTTRRRDIGIRVAIGARPYQALQSVLSRTSVLLGMGVLAGMAVSIASAPLLRSVMFHASTRDPLVVVVVAVVMTAIGLGAVWTPARRALAVDPARTLREA
jgi:predicted permease